MTSIDSITLIIAIVLFGLGLALGFGRVLKFFTHGIFGMILSVFLCVTFGGMIAGIPAVADWIAALNAKLGETWSFLGTIHFATVVYYIVLFFAMQILRIIAVRFIAQIFQADVLPMRIVNRALGAVASVAAVLLLVLLVFALVKIFENQGAVADFVKSLEGSFLGTLYAHNPVKFV